MRRSTTNAYYAMSLSGNGARIIVRDWLEATVPRSRGSTSPSGSSDLAIVEPDGVARRSATSNLARCSTAWSARISTNCRRSFRTQLLPRARCAAGRSPQPRSPPRCAVSNSTEERTIALQRPARLALIKACLLRSPIHQTKPKQRHEPDRTQFRIQSPTPPICAVGSSRSLTACNISPSAASTRAWSSVTTPAPASPPRSSWADFSATRSSTSPRPKAGSQRMSAKDFEALAVGARRQVLRDARSRSAGPLRPRLLPPESRIPPPHHRARRKPLQPQKPHLSNSSPSTLNTQPTP